MVQDSLPVVPPAEVLLSKLVLCGVTYFEVELLERRVELPLELVVVVLESVYGQLCVLVTHLQEQGVGQPDALTSLESFLVYHFLATPLRFS